MILNIIMIIGIVFLSVYQLRMIGGIFAAFISDKYSLTMKIWNAFETLFSTVIFILLVISYFNH